MGKIRSFLKNCVRVLRVTKKPSREEYISAIKVTGIGILVIGLIGFIIFLIFKLISVFG